ncbi:SPOR domain-containing protein [Sphingomicrobium aestuariivivum]|uniref:SPOR domain-containing protein n=1 Tax=Sphingomicrobium aestuariivivum TaxID=1582356 RepID=UPI001FD6B091|nr:SPOR domain-containing protein [Sphingomicrobium aestuariivivum]MCJ8190642.1 SPOR domain-containing protein [Sphingomicrobium aestuariivivum]
MSVEDEERLPWLEAVDDQQDTRQISATKIAAGAGLVLVGLIAVALTTFMLGRESGGGAPTLIEAPEEPYKTRPENPGGLDLSEDSGTAHATSVGEDPDAKLDTSKMDEDVPRIVVEEPEPAPAPKPAPTRTATAEPSPAPTPAPAASGGTGPLIQLAAYSSRAQAEKGWALLSSRFSQVAALEKVIQQATVNGATVYRLRARAADAGQARAACNALDAAGEACVILN